MMTKMICPLPRSVILYRVRRTAALPTERTMERAWSVLDWSLAGSAGAMATEELLSCVGEQRETL